MNTNIEEASPIRVAILDDHQSTLDGYAYRLNKYEHIRVVATARFGSQLDDMMEQQPVDLLLLDVSVPISEDDPNPFPLLHKLPQLRAQYPDTAILIVSMHKHRTLVRAVMEAGAKGYIVKDDHQAILQLGEIITSIAAGGVFFSEQSYAMMSQAGAGDDEIKALTPRQIEALSLYAAEPDISTAALAKRMNIAPSTLRNLLSDIYMRLNVRNRSSAILKARQLGLITPYPPDPEAGD